MTETSPQTIQEFFKRDFEKLLGFDIFNIETDLLLLIESNLFKILTRLEQEHLTNAYKAIEHLNLTYLRYDEVRFPNPIDQYTFIYEHRNDIIKVINDHLTTNMYENYLSMHLNLKMVVPFKHSLFKYLLNAGKTHRFNPEYSPSRL